MRGAARRFPTSTLIDSSGTLALIDVAESNHAAAVTIDEALLARRARLLTTNFLIDETYTLLLIRLGYRYAIGFLDAALAGSTTLIQVTPLDEGEARRILHTHRDKRFSYTDATCFAVMQRVGIQSVFTFDRNFSQYGRFVVLGA